MSVTIVADMIRLCLRDLGALPPGDNPSTEEYDDALDDLNVMLESFSADESLLPRRSYNFSVSTSGVAIGPSQTLSTTGRVVKLLGAALSSGSPAVDTPLAIGQFGDYQRIQNKTATGQPTQVFLNPGVLVYGTVYFDRVPDKTYSLLLETQEQFGNYANTGADLNLPDEYNSFLRFNLAVILSNQFGGLTPAIAAEARRSRERVQYLNHGYLQNASLPSSDLIV